jgi:polar amino acid transport system substrate-binding protein
MKAHGPRRLWWVGALALVLVAGVALLRLGLGAAWLPWGKKDIWQSLQRSGVLRICMDASYPPFEDVDAQGRFLGFDVDLAHRLAARWGLQAQFVNIHFDGLYDALLADRCDLLLSALPYDRTMTRDLLYSQSYFNAGQVLLVRSGEDDVQQIADLVGRRVAVELGSEGHHWLREWNRYRPEGIEIVTVREIPELGDVVRRGDAEAAVCDHITALGLLQSSSLQIVGAPLSEAPLVAATRRDGAQLATEIDLALKAWRRDGVLDALQQRWFQPSADD